MEDIAIVIFMVGIVMMVMGIIAIIDANNRVKVWKNYAEDKDKMQDGTIKWLATNLGEYGDFDRSPENSNVIRFKRRK